MAKARKPKRILFCGAFKLPENGSMGGVLYACRTLLNSDAGKKTEWTLVDSIQPLPPPPFYKRGLLALQRCFHSIRHLLFGNVGGTLVFTPFLAMSLLEKITICTVSGLLNKPTVVAFRSEIKLGRYSKYVIYPFLGFALKRITHVMCQSNEARVELEKLYPKTKHKYATIPNWIEVPDLPEQESNQDGFSNICRLSFIGWLEPIKDVSTILHALARLKTTGWSISICGDGSEKKQLTELAKTLNILEKVTFHGWVGPEEKEVVFENTDLFIMSSLSEGMPNSLLEAMAKGKPIISSNVGGIPSLVKHEVNGLLFPAKDSSTLARHLEYLIGKPEVREKMSKANIEKIRTDHDVRIASQKILHLLGAETPSSIQTTKT